MKIASWFIPEVSIILPQIGIPITAANEVSKEILGMKYEIPFEQTIVEMGYSLIEHGLVPDKRKSKVTN